MPSSPRSVYRCTECGAEYPKWLGRCESCGAWNTVAEEAAPRARARGRQGRLGGGRKLPPGASLATPVRLSDVAAGGLKRWTTGINEFDFVLGGGVVPGSLTIVGGEPGIGKSTLLLQCAARLEAAGVPTLYVSGEESVDQVRLRADRLGGSTGDVRRARRRLPPR